MTISTVVWVPTTITYAIVAYTGHRDDLIESAGRRLSTEFCQLRFYVSCDRRRFTNVAASIREFGPNALRDRIERFQIRIPIRSETRFKAHGMYWNGRVYVRLIFTRIPPTQNSGRPPDVGLTPCGKRAYHAVGVSFFAWQTRRPDVRRIRSHISGRIARVRVTRSGRVERGDRCDFARRV